MATGSTTGTSLSSVAESRSSRLRLRSSPRRVFLQTIKNHLPMPMPEAGESLVEIDFNYAYNPSCAYSPRWACPLAPPENWLPVPVRAGEKNYKAP